MKKIIMLFTLIAVMATSLTSYAYDYVTVVSGEKVQLLCGAAYVLSFDADLSENGGIEVNVLDSDENVLGSAKAETGTGSITAYSCPIVMPVSQNGKEKIKVTVEKIIPEGAAVDNVRFTLVSEDILMREEEDDKVYIMGNISGTSDGSLKLYAILNGEEYDYTNPEKVLYVQDLNLPANTSFKEEFDVSGINTYLNNVTIFLSGLSSYGYAVDGTALDFAYRKATMRDELIGKLSGAADAGEIKALLDVKDDPEWPNMRVLELDDIEIVNAVNDTSFLSKYLFANKDKIASDLKELATQASVISWALDKKDEETLIKYIEMYKDVIGFSDEKFTPYSRVYENMSEEVKKQAVEDLCKKSVPENIDDFKNAFANAVLRTEASSVSNYSEIISTLKNVQEFLGIDFSKYTLSDNAKIAIANYAKTTDDFFTISGKIPALIKNTNNNTAWNGSPSGSNKGGSYSGFSYSNTVPENPLPTQGKVFTDIKDDHWALKYIKTMAEKNILNGYEDGSFKPDNSVTREEFAKIVAIAFDMVSESAKCSFNDISEDDWSYVYIASLFEKGIVTGNGNGSFNKTGNISRQDMAVILNRIADYNGITGEMKDADFSDKGEISDYAREAVSQIATLGIMTGRENNFFVPNGNATRAETSKVVSTTLELID